MSRDFDMDSTRSADEADWLKWGPYMSNREWGTVRETSAREGSNWRRMPYKKANQTAYKYGEDGIFGVCDSECRLCHSYAFWNYKDTHIKERLFGVTNEQGSYGEDVKELYYYKAADTQYCYLSAEYLYPQIQFPYEHLINFEGALKTINDLPHFDTNTTSVVSLTDINSWFEDQRYFEIEFEMCKLAPDQMFFQLSVTNEGKNDAKIVVMPMLFLRNTWDSARISDEDVGVEKVIKTGDNCLIVCIKDTDGNVIHFRYHYDHQVANPEILLTHNSSKDGAVGNLSPSKKNCSKDSFNRYIVSGDRGGLLSNLDGSPSTKTGICYRLNLESKKQVKLRSFLTLVTGSSIAEVSWPYLVSTMEEMRVKQMVDSYQMLPSSLLPIEQDILNSAYTTLLWNRQFYPIDRMDHLFRLSGGRAVPIRLVTVPDKWEQPYLATWDTAFHCLTLNCFDRRQALKELMLLIALIRPDGSIFIDEYRPEGVTPPVIILAAIDVYSMCTPAQKFSLGPKLYTCLKRHLRWWLHRKDARGVQLIDGGVCGVDYVSLFPRECVETSEGLIWATFFLMRFIELTLAIYMTPGCNISSIIEADLPEYIRYLGRLCAVFVQNVSQENGLYHPTWLDVAGGIVCCSNGNPCCKAEAVVGKNHLKNDGSNLENSASSEDWDTPAGCRGPRTSCCSDADLQSVDDSLKIVGASSQKRCNEPVGSSSDACNAITNDGNTKGRKRCNWIHAYCYLPVICCCSLPNVPLKGCQTTVNMLEDLLASSFNGPSDWETRAPYIYTNKDHSRLFISVLNSLQLSELLEQLLSEIQFLSQYGIRTMSMLHICDEATARVSADNNVGFNILKQKFCPGPSVSRSYGGNTNWYGGVNLPYNYLVIESLNKWANVLDKKFDLIEYPSYTGKYRRLREIVKELARRNVALFLPNANGIIPSTGDDGKRGLLMYETFDGDSGRGYGARHKGGWSAIIARTLLLMHNLEP